jgi:hypothetical protein
MSLEWTYPPFLSLSLRETKHGFWPIDKLCLISITGVGVSVLGPRVDQINLEHVQVMVGQLDDGGKGLGRAPSLRTIRHLTVTTSKSTDGYPGHGQYDLEFMQTSKLVFRVPINHLPFVLLVVVCMQPYCS